MQRPNTAQRRDCSDAAVSDILRDALRNASLKGDEKSATLGKKKVTFSDLPTPGHKAKRFLDHAPSLDANLIDSFVNEDEIEGKPSPSKARRGSLRDLSTLLGSFSQSQQDVLEACKKARETADDFDWRAKENLRRLSYTGSFISKMRKGYEEVKRNTFKEGGDSHSKWEDLREAFRIKRRISAECEAKEKEEKSSD